MEARYNMHSPSVQRILKEIKEIHNNPSHIFTVEPLENNIFEWHFTFHGCSSDFEGGIYHGKVLLPTDYPFTPPDIIFLTPNGRFEVGKKICLTISSHHAETWQPSWSVRTVILAIIGFMPSSGDGAIASLDYPREERQRLAKKSLEFHCHECGSYNLTALPPLDQAAILPQEELPIQLKPKDQQLRDDVERAKKNSQSVPTQSTSNDRMTESAVRASRVDSDTDANPPPAYTPSPTGIALRQRQAMHGRESTVSPSHLAIEQSSPPSKVGKWLDAFITFLVLMIVLVVVKRSLF